MKASELTEPGYYWYQDEKRWKVIYFGSDDLVTFTGNELPYWGNELPGQCVGPIPQPPESEWMVIEWVTRNENGEPIRCREALSSIPDWAQHLFR